MIRMIFHQIWNQRRQNLWIWLELAVLSAFLWVVLDPLFTMLCLKHVPDGFDRNCIYRIDVVYKGGVDRTWDDPNFVSAMDNLLTQLQAYPAVEAVCLGPAYQIPGGESWSMGPYYRNAVHAKPDEGKDWKEMEHYTRAVSYPIPCITGLEKWTDVLYTFGVRDAATGEYLHVRPDALAQKLTYVSAGTARRLYGTVNVRDSTLYVPENEGGRLCKIDGVYADVKGREYETPFPSVYELMNYDGEYIGDFCVYVRLKEGADGEQFVENVPKDVLKDCCTRPFTEFTISSVGQQIDDISEHMGAKNVVRLQASLGFFGLLCVFLGISGLFWVRCGERRQDIGVMRSMGATRRAVKRQMLWEGIILLTAAFLVAMAFVAWYVHHNGYNMGLTEHAIGGWKGPDLYYWFNRPRLHIAAVTLLTYALMLGITLLGTWVPVQRATRILPSDALRDE